jgi:hypothetical protein
MKFKVFPKEYQPQIACGPPSDYMKNKVGSFWTEEDTKRHKEMEQQFTIYEGEKPPVGHWTEIIE